MKHHDLAVGHTQSNCVPKAQSEYGLQPTTPINTQHSWGDAPDYGEKLAFSQRFEMRAQSHDLIKPSDPTTLDDLISAGVGQRLMFDRRQNTFVTYEAFLFNAFFDDSLTAEVQVNPEFGTQDEAMAAAVKYTEAIGRLPTALREKMETVWIHKGIQPFGGGNNNILIHTGQGELYINDGILEETFVHEAAHTSLDPDHATAAGWIAAQEADPTFISTYAQQFSQREDIAESFLPYLAVRFRSDRISEELKQIILLTMPNRIAYFDSLMLDMHPID